MFPTGNEIRAQPTDPFGKPVKHLEVQTIHDDEHAGAAPRCERQIAHEPNAAAILHNECWMNSVGRHDDSAKAEARHRVQPPTPIRRPCIDTWAWASEPTADHQPLALLGSWREAGIKHFQGTSDPVAQQFGIWLRGGGLDRIGQNVEANIGISGDSARRPGKPIKVKPGSAIGTSGPNPRRSVSWRLAHFPRQSIRLRGEIHQRDRPVLVSRHFCVTGVLLRRIGQAQFSVSHEGHQDFSREHFGY
jgi:hypothetical protein